MPPDIYPNRLRLITTSTTYGMVFAEHRIQGPTRIKSNRGDECCTVSGILEQALTGSTMGKKSTGTGPDGRLQHGFPPDRCERLLS